MNRPRILIAGIGNIFLGDDAFGVEVAQRLGRRALPDAVRVVDFGIRGLDLVYTLLDGYDAVILVDAVPRGGPPEPADLNLFVQMHALDPAKVLRLAAALGGQVRRLLLVGCEPGAAAEVEDMSMGLSAPVRAAVDEAVSLIESLVTKLLREENEAFATSVEER